MTPQNCMRLSATNLTDDGTDTKGWPSDDACFIDATCPPEYPINEPSLYVEGNKVEFSPTRPTAKEQELFVSLAQKWRRETSHLSRADKIIANQAYRRIVDMGEPAVPMILRELEREPDYWFWALLEITNSDPIAAEIRGNVKAMASAWIEWGKANGYAW